MGIDGREVALKGAKAFLKQVFVDRFFHADPHPGNFSVLTDGRLALVDFGMVGRLDSELLEEIANVLLAVADWDAGRAARHLLRMRVSEEDVEEESFKSDLAYLIEGYAGRPLKEINLGHVINETIYIAARYRIKMPPDCVLLGKAIVTKSKRDKKRGVSWCVETRNRNKTPSASFPLCKNHDAFVTLCEPVAP
jgi:ubiquinone biosynthesis protein